MKVVYKNTEYELREIEVQTLRALAAGYSYVQRAHGLRLMLKGLAKSAPGGWRLTELAEAALREEKQHATERVQSDPGKARDDAECVRGFPGLHGF